MVFLTNRSRLYNLRGQKLFSKISLILSNIQHKTITYFSNVAVTLYVMWTSDRPVILSCPNLLHRAHLRLVIFFHNFMECKNQVCSEEHLTQTGGARKFAGSSFAPGATFLPSSSTRTFDEGAAGSAVPGELLAPSAGHSRSTSNVWRQSLQEYHDL